MKNIFSKIFKNIVSNKKTVVLGLAAVLFLTLVPLHFAQANIFSDIWNGIMSIPIRLGGMLVALVLCVIGLVLGYMSYLLTAICSWFIDLTFKIKVVPGVDGTADFLTQMWSFTRDFANIFFILILAIIGLATILRLEKYQMKKTLPMLILMALLINFSGVIVGVIVDISNIFTKALLSLGAIGGNDSTAVWDWMVGGTDGKGGYLWKAGEDLLTNWSVTWFDIMTTSVAVALGGIMLIVFFATICFVYFVLTVIFFMRIVVLWILVILAPIVFAMRILPATKTYWNQWWQQLIQWSIVGIPIAFFIVLSNAAAEAGSSLFGVGGIPEESVIVPSGTLQVNLIVDGISKMLGPITAAILLFVGIGISASFAPKSAQGIINFGEKQGKKAFNWTKHRGATAIRERIPENVLKSAERLSASRNPKWGEGQRGLMGALKRGAAGSMGTTNRKLGGAVTKATVGADENISSKAGAEAKKRDVFGNLQALRQATSESEKREIISAMIDQKQMKDAQDKNVVGDNAITPKEIQGAYKNALLKRKSDVVEKMERSFIDKRDDFAEIKDMATVGLEEDETLNGLTRKDKNEKGYENFGEKIIAEAKSAEDVKQLQKNWYEDSNLMLGVHKSWGASQAGEAAKSFGKPFIDRIDETKQDAKWYFEVVNGHERNSSLPTYLSSSGAQALGMNSIPGLENKEDIKRLREEIKRGPIVPPISSPPTISSQEMRDDLVQLEKQLEDLNKLEEKTQEDIDAISAIEKTIIDVKNRLAARIVSRRPKQQTATATTGPASQKQQMSTATTAPTSQKQQTPPRPITKQQEKEMVNEINKMTIALNRWRQELKDRPMMTQDDEKEIKENISLTEKAMEEIKKRLGKS